LQGRVLAAAPPITTDPKQLYDEMRKFLRRGSDEGALTTGAWQVHRLLFPKARDLPARGQVQINGGRIGSDAEVFVRADGATFDFGVTIDYDSTPPSLVAYRFQIRYPGGTPVPFLRYDLNRPETQPKHDVLNEPRCHLHPGSDDVRVPSPLAHPVELLAFMVYGP
jgi:hypothetical protein